MTEPPETGRVVVSASAREAILAHARETAPAEAVGVLAGQRASPDRVTRIERAQNAAADPTARYALDPAALLSLLEAIEDAGEDVVGFYHSHPRGPEGPSRTDEARATWEGYVYAIASLEGDPSLRAWRWTGERFRPLAITVRS